MKPNRTQYTSKRHPWPADVRAMHSMILWPTERLQQHAARVAELVMENGIARESASLIAFREIDAEITASKRRPRGAA